MASAVLVVGGGGRRQVAAARRSSSTGSSASPTAARCCSAAATRWARARRSRRWGARSAARPASTRPKRSRASATSWPSAWRRHVEREAARARDRVPRRDRERLVPRRRQRRAARRARQPAADGRRHAARLGGLAGGRVRGASGAAGARGPALGRSRHGQLRRRRAAQPARPALHGAGAGAPRGRRAVPRAVAGARAAGDQPGTAVEARQREAGARGAGRRVATPAWTRDRRARRRQRVLSGGADPRERRGTRAVAARLGARHGAGAPRRRGDRGEARAAGGGVFGERFSRGGVAALLGGEASWPTCRTRSNGWRRASWSRARRRPKDGRTRSSPSRTRWCARPRTRC